MLAHAHVTLHALLPAALAAVPGISNVASGVKNEIGKLASGIVGLVDPGKARDKAREAKAESFYQAALSGSVTAARYVYGGQTMVYTSKEKGYYVDRWNKLLSGNPTIAQQAQAAGPLSPGGDADFPPPNQQTQMQAEIQAWADKVRGATSDLVANVAAGAGTQLSQKIAPTGQGKTLIPISYGQMAAVAIGLLLLFLLIRRR